jgi:DNA-directed RNA polymerase subunit RPC12/RpoP
MLLACADCGNKVERKRARKLVVCDKCQYKRQHHVKTRWRELNRDLKNQQSREYRRQTPAAINLAPWLCANGLPPGYEVLCFNCNIGKGIHGKCPHELAA